MTQHFGFTAEARTVPICGLGVELRYISLVEMIREFDPTELAQLATHQEHAQITGEMLVAQIQGMPLDEWTDAQRVAVVAVVQKLCHVCVRAEQTVEWLCDNTRTMTEVMVMISALLMLSTVTLSSPQLNTSRGSRASKSNHN